MNFINSINHILLSSYLLVNQKPLLGPQVLPLVMSPASPEVTLEDTHEGEQRRHPPVNALLSVELHV